jgi:hypothetical protein
MIETDFEKTDNMLSRIIEFLDAEDYAALDILVAGVVDELHYDTAICSDRGLARVQNVLALTYRHAIKLPHRNALRTAFHQRVLEHEDQEHADRAIQYL